MRGDATIFKGDTFVEIAAVYYTTIIDDPRSFTEALRATETYVKSKINKGKRDAVGAPGGKLERLEAKYAHLGFQDIFYLTRVNLGLPPSSLALPPPSDKVRARLVQAGFQIPHAAVPERGRPTSVKDLSRPGSRTTTPMLGPQRAADLVNEDEPELPTLDDLAMGRNNPWDGPAQNGSPSTLSAALLHVASTRRYAQMPTSAPPSSPLPPTPTTSTSSIIIRSRPLRDLAAPPRPQPFPPLPPVDRPPLTPSSSTTSQWSSSLSSPELAFDMDIDTARDPFAASPAFGNQLHPFKRTGHQPGSDSSSIRNATSRMSARTGVTSPIARDYSASAGPPSSLISPEEMARFGIRQTEMIRTMMDFERFKQDMTRTRTPPPEYARVDRGRAGG